ncbi:MAG: hypothetical protein EXS67_05635 [Candidatus Margulisbacteria bacterium]|nr:hypothetical protein [Candidatus Margulisiibacteriota bacterium]
MLLDKISQFGIYGDKHHRFWRKIILSNQLIFLLIVSSSPYILIFELMGNSRISWALIFVNVLFLSCLLANKFKRYTLARIALLFFANLATLFFTLILGKNTGIFYLLFAFICLPMIIFESYEKVKILACSAFPVICYLVIESNFNFLLASNFFVTAPLPENYVSVIRITVSFVTFIIGILSIKFLLNQNYLSEKELLDTNEILKQQYEELKEKKRMDAELVTAAEIQRSVLPQSPPKIVGFEVEDWFVPARGVSGDYFDYVEISATRTGFLIADITGKGIPAALMMMNFRSLWQSFDVSIGTPSENLTQLNTLLYYHPTIKKQVPMIFGILDSESRVFTYCNAGHEPGLHVYGNTAEELKVSGPALGLEPAIVLEDHSIVFSENDRLLLFTDGVTDIKNPKKARFGHAALLEMIFSLTASLPENNFLELFKANIMAYMQHEPQADDITLVSLVARQNTYDLII